jgi:hypothetical protein
MQSEAAAAPKSEALLLVHKSTLLWVIISGIFAQLGYWLHCSPFGRLTSCIFFQHYMPLGRRNLSQGRIMAGGWQVVAFRHNTSL